MPIENSSSNILGVKRLSSGESLFAHIVLGRKEVSIESLFIQKEDEALSDDLLKAVPIKALSAEVGLVRSTEIPLKRARDLDRVLPFQVEPLLPYPIEEGQVERTALRREESKTFLTFVAIKNESIETFLEEQPLEPEILTIESVSLAHFSHHVSNSSQPHFALFIDEDKTLVVVSKEGELLAAHSFDLGVDEAATESFSKRVNQTILSLTKQLKFPLQRSIVVSSVKPLDNLSFIPKNLRSVPFDQKMQAFAIPIGSALSALHGAKGGVNFRKGPFAYSKPWKRLKTSLFSYFALTTAAALSLFLFGKAKIYQEKQILLENWALQLQMVDQEVAQFEERYHEKFLRLPFDRDEGVDLASLSLSDLSERIGFLQQEVQSAPNLFALHPNIPRVSDLLAYLATHPQVSLEDEDESKLKLVNLSYQMVKRPDMSKKKERYQVKVEMEFKADSPKSAREFHDALVAQNNFIDPKGEIKWSTARGLYRTSFYLKDKTHYPT